MALDIIRDRKWKIQICLYAGSTAVCGCVDTTTNFKRRQKMGKRVDGMPGVKRRKRAGYCMDETARFSVWILSKVP